VARRAANVMKVYLENEKKPICIDIFIHSLKYINIFLILYTKCARKFVYVSQCAANQIRLRITGIDTDVIKYVTKNIKTYNHDKQTNKQTRLITTDHTGGTLSLGRTLQKKHERSFKRYL
jgi:hypothetical protein